MSLMAENSRTDMWRRCCQCGECATCMYVCVCVGFCFGVWGGGLCGFCGGGASVVVMSIDFNCFLGNMLKVV